MDRKRDLELLVHTTGLRSWTGTNAKRYNRAESTPYKALDDFFKCYEVSEDDVFVDFGAGRGRTSFYVHNRFGIPVRGVELHELTFDDLVKNERHYLRAKGLEFSNIYFEFGYAEQYQIQEDENIFYFFNPFSVGIFREVVANILASLEKNPREADLILYFPENAFKKFMEHETPFKRLKTIRLPWKAHPKKKFIVYRYTPEINEDEE